MYDQDKIVEIYCVDNYEDNPYFSYDLNDIEQLSNNRFRNYKRALDFVESVSTPGNLLDIGCGTGTFLAMAEKRNWKIHGVEISEKLSEKCRENVDGQILTGRFEDVDLEEEQFDLITMWDVIEHVIDPVDVVSRVKSLLKPGGIALYCTPDEDSLLARIGWWMYKLSLGRVYYPAFALHPPNHTYFFSRKGYRKIMEKIDMQVISAYSQDAFFEHSEMASRVQKTGIGAIERAGGLADAKYEMVVLAKK